MIAWGIVLLGILAAMITGGVMIAIAFLVGCVLAGNFAYSKSWSTGRKILVILLLAPLPLAITAVFIIKWLA